MPSGKPGFRHCACGEILPPGRARKTCGKPECRKLHQAKLQAGYARAKWQARKQVDREVVRDLAVTLYQSGLTQQEVARRLGCAQSVVSCALREAGVTARRKGRPRKEE